MDQIAQHYPEAAPYLEVLPHHAIEHIGSVATRLTHEDMHPQLEVQGNREAVSIIDISKVITDPEFDSSQLAADAVEAAHAGKEKLANLLLTSSKMIHSAYEGLTETGYHFGSTELETDEQRNTREKAERDNVYDTALSHALDAAVTAKESGNDAEVVKQLEALILVRYVKGVTFDTNREVLRRTVRKGLANELLTATQTMDKICTGDTYGRVSNSMYDAKNLLEMVTGKSYYGHFEEHGQKSLAEIRPTSGEELRDAMAAMTTKNSWLTLEKGFDTFESANILMEFKEKFNPEAAEGEMGSAEYFYQLVEDSGESNELSEVLKCADPREALRVANKLGIKPFQAVSMFGRYGDEKDPIDIDSRMAERMAELKQAHPADFAVLVEAHWSDKTFHHADHGIIYDPLVISMGIDKLQAAGVHVPELSVIMTAFPNTDRFTDFCSELSQALVKYGKGIGDLEIMTKAAGMDSFSRILKDAVLNVEQTSADKLAADIMTRTELTKSYIDLYLKNEYENKGRPGRPELDSLPVIQDRIKALGIPDALATEMFKSWATYDEFLVQHFDGDKLNLPTEVPEYHVLQTMAQDQAKVLARHINVLELFAESYGIETMQSIIETFGIYNFGQHKLEDLIRQKEAWDTGEKVESVVVDARSDWNTYAGGKTVFKDEAGKGVFYFEANSGPEAARIAVRVGQHERSHGREPDVKRFIVHAHGNSSGMVLGVNKEAIDTRDYINAARNARKINAGEVNDYKRHLGPDFQVILQSCSTAADNYGAPNIAETMNESHNALVHSSDIKVYGVTIHSDGTVKYNVPPKEGDGKPVTYDNVTK